MYTIPRFKLIAENKGDLEILKNIMRLPFFFIRFAYHRKVRRLVPSQIGGTAPVEGGFK